MSIFPNVSQKAEMGNKPACDQTKVKNKAAVSKLQQEKKLALKKDENAKTDDKEKKQATKPKRSRQRAAKNFRPLTDAEYQDIFKAVIDIEEDVYTALTQVDSQNETEAEGTEDGALAKASKDEKSASNANHTTDEENDPNSTHTDQEKKSVDSDQESDGIGGQGLKNDIKRDESLDKSELASSKENKTDVDDGKVKRVRKRREKVKGKEDLTKETDSKEEEKHGPGDGIKKGRDDKKQKGKDREGRKRRKKEEGISNNTEGKGQLCVKPDMEGGENEERGSQAEKAGGKNLSRKSKKREGKVKDKVASEGGKKDDVASSGRETDEVASEGGEEDVASVVSEQSISSSLLGMAVDVDQWDRYID